MKRLWIALGAGVAFVALMSWLAHQGWVHTIGPLLTLLPGIFVGKLLPDSGGGSMGLDIGDDRPWGTFPTVVAYGANILFYSGVAYWLLTRFRFPRPVKSHELP